MSADCFTLDDFIKKKNIGAQFSLMNMRKKDRENIDEDELNASLDEIARKNAAKRGLNCGIAKFDRFNDDSGNQSDNDDENEEESDNGSDYRKSYERISSDMEMMDISEDNNIQSENSSIRFAKEIQQMEHPECCRIKKRFTTVESAKGIKIKSQQWRVENPNSRNEKVLNGRVEKNYKKNGTNIGGAKAGIFVEKGSFTYKFNDNPGNDSDDNAESIVGIVRNRPVTKIIRVGNNNNGYNNNNRNFNNNFRNRQNVNGNSPVNINMNWNGFFKGMTECMKTVAPTTQPLERKAPVASADQDIQVKIAATELFDFLLAKRNQANKQNQRTSFSEPPKSDPMNEFIVSASAGNGIEMDFVPSVTNMPMNLRFA